jgi:hypothetical protein
MNMGINVRAAQKEGNFLLAECLAASAVGLTVGLVTAKTLLYGQNHHNHY